MAGAGGWRKEEGCGRDWALTRAGEARVIPESLLGSFEYVHIK